MKKSGIRVALAVVLLAALCLAGCGSAKTTSKKASDNAKQSESASKKSSDKTEEKSSGDGYVFETNGVKIAINAKAADIVKKLGDPLSKYEATSCAFGDLDITYTYADFELITYQLKGVDYISQVTLLDDNVATPEGVAIGDAASKVQDTYGKPDSEDNGSYLYKKGDMKLLFVIEDDMVSSIQYQNTKLD